MREIQIVKSLTFDIFIATLLADNGCCMSKLLTILLLFLIVFLPEKNFALMKMVERNNQCLLK